MQLIVPNITMTMLINLHSFLKLNYSDVGLSIIEH